MQPGTARPHGWTLLWVLALLITAIGVFLPLSPVQPSAGMDASWQLAVNEAAARKLAFGTDILFTFGPYAAIYSQMYHPGTDAIMVLGGLYLGLSFWLAAWLTFRQAPWGPRLLLILALAAIVTVRDGLFLFYPLLVGTGAFALAKRPRTRTAAMLMAVLAAPLGLLPLIKLSLLVASVSVLLLSSVVLIGRRRADLLAALLAAPVLATAALWQACGQATGGLPAYYVSAVPLISGYAEAMGLPGSPFETALYAITSLLVAATVFRGMAAEGLATRLAMTLMFGSLLFLAFKAGFVRQDQHALTGGTFIVLCGLTALALHPSRRQPLVAVWMAVTLLVVLHDVPGATRDMLRQAGRTYTDLWSGLARRITDPDHLRRAFDESLAAIRRDRPIPAGAGTSDIYSYDQADLIASGNRWNPRPVLQSYSAYAPSLAEANRRHLLGARAPDTLFFRLQPIDTRLPALEDGPSWRVMLARYAPAPSPADTLVLRRKPGAPAEVPTLAGAAATFHRMGERVAVPGGNGLLFARLRLAPTAAGRLWSAAFRPSQLRITLRLASGEERSFRLIAGMAASEFLLSPLVETTAEFGKLAGNLPELAGKTVQSFTLEDLGGPATWDERYALDLMPAPEP